MAATGGAGAVEEALGGVMVLRLLRLLRLARALRLFASFKAMWMLVRGLLSSGMTVGSCIILITLILYLYACVALELITNNDALKQDPEHGEVFTEIVEVYFSSIGHSMLTFIMFVTVDSVAAIYCPLMHMQPITYTVFFMSFVVLVAIALMNLITAVIVEGSLALAAEDKEVTRAYKAAQLKAVIPKIRDMFIDLDVDGNGELDLEEVLNAPQELKDELGRFVDTDDIKDLFDFIDVDGGGAIDVDEFVQGVSKIVASDEPMENLRMKKLMQLTRTQVSKIEQEILPEMEQRITADLKEHIDSKLEIALEKMESYAKKARAAPRYPSPPPGGPGGPDSPDSAGYRRGQRAWAEDKSPRSAVSGTPRSGYRPDRPDRPRSRLAPAALQYF
jgi:Ca2+-binding EF-hand superfamily protein